jgi:hypothetical protein
MNSKSATAMAQTIDIGITPPIFEVQIIPPADTKVPFQIQNFTDNPVDLNISIKPFIASKDENGQIEFINNPNWEDPFLPQRINVLDGNIRIDSLSLNPRETRNLVLEFKIPSNEQKGEYYFSLVFSSVPKLTAGTNQSVASVAVSSNVLLSIGPLGKNQGRIEDFSTSFFKSKGPVPFNVRIKNTSDHFETIKGDIIVTNMFGQTIGKIKLLPVNILANSIRKVPDILQSGTASEAEYNQIKPIVEKSSSPVAVWPEKFLLGLYSAKLTVSMSDQGPIYTRTIYFFAFPLEYLLAILIIITLMIFIILRVRRRLILNSLNS